MDGCVRRCSPVEFCLVLYFGVWCWVVVNEKLAWWGPRRVSFSELTFSQNPLSIHVHGHVSCGRGLVVVVADRWIEARSKVDY